MKKLTERDITKNFIKVMKENAVAWENVCPTCNVSPCECGSEESEYDYPIDGQSYEQLDPDNDGVVSQEDLYNHFDLDNDGTVTTDEYVDHVQYHADNPESLDHYREDVPCQNSYNSCKSYYDNDHEILKQCVSDSGATCMQSGIQALIDVLTSLKNNGMI